jgi:hypothetical protein
MREHIDLDREYDRICNDLWREFNTPGGLTDATVEAFKGLLREDQQAHANEVVQDLEMTFAGMAQEDHEQNQQNNDRGR